MHSEWTQMTSGQSTRKDQDAKDAQILPLSMKGGSHSDDARKAYEALPDKVPKHWLRVCEVCMLPWIPNFKTLVCPVCHPVKKP